MNKTTPRVLSVLLASTFLVALIFITAHHSFAQAPKKFDDKNWATWLQNAQKESSVKKLTSKTSENVSGTITAISGNDITVTFKDPVSGKSSMAVIHAGSASVSLGKNHVVQPKSKDSTKIVSLPHARVAQGIMKNGVRSPQANLTSLSNLSVGDSVSIIGTKNNDGTISAKRVMAHEPKPAHPLPTDTKPKS